MGVTRWVVGRGLRIMLILARTVQVVLLETQDVLREAEGYLGRAWVTYSACVVANAAFNSQFCLHFCTPKARGFLP